MKIKIEYFNGKAAHYAIIIMGAWIGIAVAIIMGQTFTFKECAHLEEYLIVAYGLLGAFMFGIISTKYPCERDILFFGMLTISIILLPYVALSLSMLS